MFLALAVLGCQPYYGLKPFPAMDHTKAVDLYRQASQQGDIESSINLGYMYQKGHGIEQNYEEAFRLYSLAAEQGSALGQLNLAVMYASGYGVPRNDDEAARLLKLAMGQGNPTATYYLAGLFIVGRGELSPDDPDAIYALRFAAENDGLGRFNAREHIAKLYMNGKLRSPKDLDVAIKYYEEEARWGSWTAKSNLLKLYKIQGTH